MGLQCLVRPGGSFTLRFASVVTDAARNVGVSFVVLAVFVKLSFVVLLYLMVLFCFEAFLSLCV